MQVNNQNKYVIQLKDAYVVYNQNKNNPFVGLKNFSFNFEKEKIYCIIGKSGSGKSTLISLFNGINRLNYGQIKLNNIELNSARNLNHCVLSTKPLKDETLIKSIIKKDKIHKEDLFFLVKTSKDTKDYDLIDYLLSISNNTEKTIYKLNHFHKQKNNINNNYNKFFLVKLNQACDLDKLNITNDDVAFNEVDKTKIKEDGVKKTKRIKQYKQLRKEIGMVSQFPEFQLFKYTVLEDVSFGLRVLGTKKPEAIALAKKELLKLGIKESHFNNSPFALSGGQKRRVAIAGILAINGNTLIFDEPTAGLDPSGEKEMLNIIMNAKKEKKNVFVVSHSMDQVLEIADEILVIHNQKLIAHGSCYEIFNNHKILSDTNIEQPYVIKMINDLIKKDKKYSILNTYQPRTIDELSQCLVKINKKK